MVQMQRQDVFFYQDSLKVFLEFCLSWRHHVFFFQPKLSIESHRDVDSSRCKTQQESLRNLHERGHGTAAAL